MEKHIDTMGFLLAAIVFSITLLGEREARRSDQQIQRVHDYQALLRAALSAGERVVPSQISDWVRRSRTERDDVIGAARALNVILIVIVIIVGGDALRLLYFTEVEGPVDATLLVLALLVGALITGAYGEVHVRIEHRKATQEFERSDLGTLARVSAALAPAKPGRRDARRWKFEAGSLDTGNPDALDTQIGEVSDRFPDWALVPELRAMKQLMSDNAEEAVHTLLVEYATTTDDYNLPVLLTAALSRTSDLSTMLPVLDVVAKRRGPDRMLDELRFDLGLANAHRSQLFASSTPASGEAISTTDALTFDVRLGDVSETSQLRAFGRAWTDPTTPLDWRPDAEAGERQRPISWLWQLVHGEELEGGLEAVQEWRAKSIDAAALEGVGFGCLAAGLDEAVDLFEAAIDHQSASGSAHWGAALSYAQRGWTRKAEVSLKRASICGYSPAICAVTLDYFADATWTYQETVNKFDDPLEFSEIVDLSLVGVVPTIEDDKTPRNRFAAQFVKMAGSSRAG